MRTIQALVAAILALTLSGCGGCNYYTAWGRGYEDICVKGVLYYQFPSGAAVAYDQEGKVRKC